MGPLQLLFSIFIIVPMVEIYFLIKVGSMFGASWTILLVVLTAVIGAALVKAQGFSTFARVQQQIRAGQVPAMEMTEGLFLLVAGALLLTPGFFTDAIGFACLTPPLRRGVIRYAMKRSLMRSADNTSAQSNHTEGSIEGEYRQVNDKGIPTNQTKT